MISAKNLVRTVLICLIFIVFFEDGKALDRNRQIDQFHHTAWTAKDGAPSQISALAQTTDGYLWIGSALGLYRFDGVEFEQFVPPVGISLPSQNIYALMTTPDNGLWISFRPSGLGFLKDGQLQIFNSPEVLPKSQVYCFARTNDGKIWAGTQSGLALFNGTGWDDIEADWNFQPKRVRTMFVDRGGTLWVSKDDAIVFLPPGATSFQEFRKQTNYILDFAQAKNDLIWMTEVEEMVTPINSALANFPKIKLHSNKILFDRDSSIWLAKFPQGIRRIRFPERLQAESVKPDDPQIETFEEENGLSGNLITNILEDREGNIWVGSDKGIDRFRYSSITPISLPKGYQRLTMAAFESNQIWSGNLENTLLKLNDKIEIKQFPVKDLWVSSFYKAAKNDIWWGTHGGILHQTNDNFKIFPPPENMERDFIWEVFRGDGDGGLWVNYGDRGLIYFKNGIWEKRQPPVGLPDRGPSASFEDEQKRIWLGYTENRVFVLDNGRVQGYSNENGIEIGRIKVIRGRNRNYWFGGELGLAFFKNGRFYTVKADGKQLGAVSGIIPTENGDVWLNEANGIIQISEDEIQKMFDNPDYAVKSRHYDFQDNLPGGPQMNFTVSTAIETDDKKLWFATDNGLALIDPSKLEKNNVAPSVIIKSIVADEKIHDGRTELKLPSATKGLQINYTATSLAIPERVTFKYRLEGLQENWQEAGTRRTAFYTNLAPGKYKFQVIAANNDGVWNEQGEILKFEILPMFYQTNWFLLICLIAFGSLIWAGYQWRVYQVKAQLSRLYEERLSERTRIAQDLHDTLLQGIVSVSMHLDSAVNKLPPESPAKSRLERMQEMLQQIIIEGRNTVNGLRSSGKINNNGDLEQELSRLNQQLNAAAKINFHVTEAGSKRTICPTIHEEIYHICREALANAFRHSEATLVEVEIEYARHFLKILIRDNGIGIDENILKTGREGHWGLSGMKERAEKIGAALKVFSRIGVGTEIELSVSNQIAFEDENSTFLNNLRGKIFRAKKIKP